MKPKNAYADISFQHLVETVAKSAKRKLLKSLFESTELGAKSPDVPSSSGAKSCRFDVVYRFRRINFVMN